MSLKYIFITILLIISTIAYGQDDCYQEAIELAKSYQSKKLISKAKNILLINEDICSGSPSKEFVDYKQLLTILELEQQKTEEHTSVKTINRPNKIKFHFGVANSTFGNTTSDKNWKAKGVPKTLFNTPSYMYGASYLLGMNEKFALEVGIDMRATDVRNYKNYISIDEKLQLLTIPVTINYQSHKYFSINGGLFYNNQSSKTIFHNQSGIGFTAGLGIHLPIQNFEISCNPYISQVILLFDAEGTQRERNLGLSIGVSHTIR